MIFIILSLDLMWPNAQNAKENRIVSKKVFSKNVTWYGKDYTGWTWWENHIYLLSESGIFFFFRNKIFVEIPIKALNRINSTSNRTIKIFLSWKFFLLTINYLNEKKKKNNNILYISFNKTLQNFSIFF